MRFADDCAPDIPRLQLCRGLSPPLPVQLCCWAGRRRGGRPTLVPTSLLAGEMDIVEVGEMGG